MPTPENASDEIARLRRTMRDVVSLSMLPAVWIGLDASRTAESLADVLLRTLSLDLLYLRLKNSAGEWTREIARGRQRPDLIGQAQSIGKAFAPFLGGTPPDSPASISNPVGEGTLQVLRVGIGQADEGGVVVAGSRRTDFPSETDRLLLTLATNQAAIVLRRHWAEESVRQQREWLRVTLASIGDAVITTDTQGRVTFLNAVAQTLTGWTQTDAQGVALDRVFRIINEHSRQPVESPADRALREGKVVGLANSTVLVAKDGTERPIDDSAAPIQDEKGKVVGVVLVFRDITERRRAEIDRKRSQERLRESQERLVAALVASDTGTFRWNPFTGEFSEFDDNLKRLFGFALEEPVRITEDFLKRIHPDDSVKLIAAVGACRQGADFEMEYRILLPDGKIRWLYERAKMERNAEGVSTYLVGACTDITARKQAEQAGALLAAIVHSSDDAIISKDLNGIITSWNESAERLFGYTAREAIGQSVTMLIPPDRLHEEPVILERLRRGERVNHFETLRMRKDGTLLDISLTISPVRDAANRVVGASKVARDIRERKQAEKALKEADRRKDEFLATLAHELRNPLAPIRNMLEILKRTEGNRDPIQQICGTMDRQLGQMIRLIDDLLDVSRISQGKISLRRERVELASILSQSVESCRSLVDSANHELNVALPPQPIYLYADAARLAQVFGNLLNNSCKYTERGGRIWLTAERQDGDVVVKVKDNGTGIPPEKLGSVFEMFTQVDRALERTTGGLGIGLSLVKRLVEMHEGTVTAHSEGQGRGSEFEVRLPVVIEQPAHTAAPTADPPKTMGHRILVVDDNRDSALSLAMLLNLTGNETHTAHDGLAAVEAAATFRPEVVLLDIGLPKLNGYDAARRIREQLADKNIMIVAMTGWGQEEDRRRSQECGIDHHLVKPLDLADLKVLLAGWLAERHSPGKPGAT